MFSCSPLLLRTTPSTLHERFPAWFTILYSFIQMPARKLQQMKRSTLVHSNEIEQSLNNSCGLIARCTFVNLMTANGFSSSSSSSSSNSSSSSSSNNDDDDDDDDDDDVTTKRKSNSTRSSTRRCAPHQATKYELGTRR